MQVSVVPAERQRSVLIILVDEEECRHIHTDIYGNPPPLPFVPTREALIDTLNQLERQGARKYVFNKLARRSYPSAELEKLLIDRLVSEQTITSILNECKQNGYINDQEWTERFIAGQVRKGHGPHLIQQKLRAKGVSAQTPPDDQNQQIQTLLQTKYRNKDLKNPKERQKVTASLARRGFDFEAIRNELG